MKVKTFVLGVALVVSAFGLNGAAAQDAVPRVALHNDWSVFNPAGQRECFVASAPTVTSAQRNNQPVQVRRSEIRLYISNRPSENVRNEVAFNSGYPFRDGSTVNVVIGTDAYELFTEGEWAWPATPEDDVSIVASMRRGAQAVITGLSSRGTTTIDTFSLIGFSAALDDANTRCFGGQ